MTEAEILIDYLDSDGLKGVHVVRSEIKAEDFSEEVQEAVEVISKDGFFLEITEARCVFIPPTRVLRVQFNLIETEEGS